MLPSDHRHERRHLSGAEQDHLGDFLSRWVDHIKSQVSPKSHERYAGIVNQNIKSRARRRSAYQVEAGPDLGGLQQGAG